MKYFSTRDPALHATAAEAILRGLAPDGGLYMPEKLPAFPMERLENMGDRAISLSVLSSLFEDIPSDVLSRAIAAAYDTNFDGGDIAPLHPLGDAHVMELFHGPTCAFKDVALTLLPHLLIAARDRCGVSDEICILTATSGDTGSAALYGFADVPGTRIIVFYPAGGVSQAQEKQMVTRAGRNVSVAAVRGNFDDAQSGVKAIFRTLTPPAGLRLSSANSINIGRLAPQIAYYFKGYRDLLRAGRIRPGDPVNFVVPTGNFGNILAGYFAGCMGLPLGRLICASNENNVLTDFFHSGVYDRRRPFRLTSSPSMDILISSNLERLLCLFCGPAETAAYMKDLEKEGVYRLTGEERDELSRRFFAAFANGEETAAAIREAFDTYGYLMDPHTAVGYDVYRKWCASPACNGAPTVILSTASPYKFSASVLRALGRTPSGDEFADMKTVSALSGTAIPAPLARLLDRPVLHRTVLPVGGMADYVRERLEVPVWTS